MHVGSNATLSKPLNCSRSFPIRRIRTDSDRSTVPFCCFQHTVCETTTISRVIRYDAEVFAGYAQDLFKIGVLVWVSSAQRDLKCMHVLCLADYHAVLVKPHMLPGLI